MQRGAGSHVRVPVDHAAAQGAGGRRGAGQGARHLLRCATPRRQQSRAAFAPSTRRLSSPRLPLTHVLVSNATLTCVSPPPPPGPGAALALLETTGIVVVPGSGFRQKKDTWHFRTTFLPPETDMDSVIAQMGTFHADFMATHK